MPIRDGDDMPVRGGDDMPIRETPKLCGDACGRSTYERPVSVGTARASASPYTTYTSQQQEQELRNRSRCQPPWRPHPASARQHTPEETFQNFCAVRGRLETWLRSHRTDSHVQHSSGAGKRAGGDHPCITLPVYNSDDPAGYPGRCMRSAASVYCYAVAHPRPNLFEHITC